MVSGVGRFGSYEVGEPGQDAAHELVGERALGDRADLGDLHRALGGQVPRVQLKPGRRGGLRRRGGGEQHQVGVGQAQRVLGGVHLAQHLPDLGHAGQRVAGGQRVRLLSRAAPRR